MSTSHPAPEPSDGPDEDEVRRLRGQLEALVAEHRALANRLIGPFRQYVEPAYDALEPYPGELEVDGVTWHLHIHGDHCLFTDPDGGTEIEVNIWRPDAIDPWFLLTYARSAGGHPEILAACGNFRDICRMLDLAAIPLDPGWLWPSGAAGVDPDQERDSTLS